MDAPKPLIIADASVLLKWVVDETDLQEEAALLRDDFKNEKVNIVVPAHCIYEIGNMLARNYLASVRSYLSFFLESSIEEYPMTFSLMNLTVLLLEQYPNISFYDASYHALAIKEEGTFVTADQKYFHKTHKEGHIMLLSDYGKKR